MNSHLKIATESRGVTITQLDSIDPTLVVYRAEATFVGVGLWDMFGAVVAPGTSRGFVPSSASGRSGECVILISGWSFEAD